MKIALITTTIHVPDVLRLYREIGPDVAFFVAGDEKTPHEKVCSGEWCYYTPNDQRNLGYACSELIGWNCIQRRNVALLEALRWGADVIVSIDDDNMPVNANYFDDFERVLLPLAGTPRWVKWWSGLRASAPWFDVGQFLIPPTPHRGLPIDAQASCEIRPATQVKVGVAAGACLGDPDCSAVIRIARSPSACAVAEPLRGGIVFTPYQNSWTVFNTQNTAFVRELAPAMFCAPGLGRYDDIVASLVCQRVMRERSYSVHFGKPFVWQQRNQHDLRGDLREEMWGVENIRRVAAALDGAGLRPGGSVIGHARDCWQELHALVPGVACKAAQAFLDDCEQVMKK